MGVMPPEESTIFFGYPSGPESLREAISAAATRIGKLPNTRAIPWESLRVSGNVVIDAVLDAVDAADLAALELTHLNPNVLFELGYSIARNRRLWLLRDTSDEDAGRKWKQFGLLTDIGYTSYLNSEHVFAAFQREAPLNRIAFFERSIQPGLTPGSDETLFYAPSAYPNEMARAISDRVEAERRQRVKVIIDDVAEGQSQTLIWYARSVYQSAAVLIHLVEARRTGAGIYNARAALTAGLAVGMDKPTLIITEDDQLAPLDYRQLVLTCSSTSTTTLVGVDDGRDGPV